MCVRASVCVCVHVCVCQTLSYVTIKMLSWGYCTDDSRGSLLLEPGWRLFWSTSEKSNQRRAAFFFTEPEKKKKKKVINLFLAVTFKYISLIITHRRTNLQSFSWRRIYILGFAVALFQNEWVRILQMGFYIFSFLAVCFSFCISNSSLEVLFL